DRFVAGLAAAGIERGLGRWLAMNLRRDPAGSGWRFGPDLDAIEALLDDYFALDLWPALEALPERTRACLVLGSRSSIFGPADRARAEALCAGSSRVSMQVIAGAGHWVHMDRPDALLALLAAAPDPEP
ncbi:MAG: alpha/beta fold hydrolase, partial [Myxococcales bacterium]|nr:alpha/beta fold hydrolase [Myxococcales bacterium]